MPFISTWALIQQPPPQFIPGRGFATYPVHPALRAQALRYILPTSTSSSYRVLFAHTPLQRQHSPSPERPTNCSPLLMVLWKEVFLPYFLDLIAEELFKEFGRPQYPKYITKLLTADFLWTLTEQGSIPIKPVSAESAPVQAPVPAPEPEESSVEIIKWDDLQQPIGFLRSTSEPAELHPAPQSTVIGLTAMLEQLVASHPALMTENEQCPAPTSQNEHRPAPMDGLTEQNSIVSIRRIYPEPLPTVHLHLIPFRPPEQLEVAPPTTTESAPQTALIVDNHTPLYNANGYKVSQVSATSAHLHFTLTPECCFQSDRNACLTHCSETEGIPMHLPLNMVFEFGDLLMLWTCNKVEHVTTCLLHPSSSTMLHSSASVLLFPSTMMMATYFSCRSHLQTLNEKTTRLSMRL